MDIFTTATQNYIAIAGQTNDKNFISTTTGSKQYAFIGQYIDDTYTWSKYVDTNPGLESVQIAYNTNGKYIGVGLYNPATIGPS